VSGALLVGSLLVACRALSILVEVDLDQRLGAQSSGSLQEELSAGDFDESRRLPHEGGQCIDFSDQDIAVTVESATLHYDLEVEFDGPEVAGKLQGRLYLAGSEAELRRACSKIVPIVTLDMTRSSTRLAGTAVLSPEQLEAVNDSFHLRGSRGEWQRRRPGGERYSHVRLQSERSAPEPSDPLDLSADTGGWTPATAA
jgi:hypothetical protein